MSSSGGLKKKSGNPQTLPFGKNGNPTVFAKWAKSREIFLHPDVAFLIPTKTMGFGVYAARPLPKGSTVVSCPLSATVSPYEKPCAESACLQVLQQIQPPVPTLLVVCLRLLEAVGKSATHAWKPWLEACPLMPDHLFHLAPALDLLTKCNDENLTNTVEDPSVAPFVTDEFRQCVAGILTAEGRYAWSNAAQSLASLHLPSLWSQARSIMSSQPSIWPEHVQTFPIFCQIASQVWSRNFHREEVKGQEGPYLLPGVDFVNHDAALTNAAFQIHGGGRSRALTFDVITTKDLQKGEQVYYNYGDIVNSRFLVEFQFVPQQNLFDALQFSWGTLETLCAEVRLRSAASSAETGEVSIAETKNMLRERIQVLHKLNLITGDGLYVQGEARFEKRLSTALEAKKADAASSIAVHDSTFFRGLEQSWWNTMYFLCVATDTEFHDVQSQLSHHWQCPKSPALLRASSAALKLRQQSVMFNDKALSAYLEGTEGGSLQTTRKALDLLKVTLARELEMLAEFVNDKEESTTAK